MKRFVFLLVLLLASAMPALAAPQLVAEGLSYDFGEIFRGEKVTYSFRFRNAGDEILQISNVRSSCGCTAAMLSSSRIAPGDTGELQATFDSTQFSGAVTKTISLDSNDPQQPELNFSLYGQIKTELALTPERVRWGKVAAETPQTSVITVANQGQTDVTLQKPRSTSPDLSIELDSYQLPAGGQVQLTVTGTLPAGKTRIGGYIIIPTDHPRATQLRLPVSARLAK
jgi:hypothetical protein